MRTVLLFVAVLVAAALASEFPSCPEFRSFGDNMCRNMTESDLRFIGPLRCTSVSMAFQDGRAIAAMRARLDFKVAWSGNTSEPASCVTAVLPVRTLWFQSETLENHRSYLSDASETTTAVRTISVASPGEVSFALYNPSSECSIEIIGLWEMCKLADAGSVITAVTPSSGPAWGGYLVTIDGRLMGDGSETFSSLQVAGGSYFFGGLDYQPDGAVQVRAMIDQAATGADATTTVAVASGDMTRVTWLAKGFTPRGLFLLRSLSFFLSFFVCVCGMV